MRSNTQYLKIANLSDKKTLQHRSARHAFPRLEGLSAYCPLLLCVGVLTATRKEISDLIVDRSEPLQVTR
jgi:hypothetical protein